VKIIYDCHPSLSHLNKSVADEAKGSHDDVSHGSTLPRLQSTAGLRDIGIGAEREGKGDCSATDREYSYVGHHHRSIKRFSAFYT